MEETGKTKRNRYLISILVIAILFALPGISWLYLQSGLDYHKKAKSELQDLGIPADFTLTNQNNLKVLREALTERITIVNFIPADIEEAKPLMDRISKIYPSFKDTEEVFFLSIMPSDSTDMLLSLATTLGIKNHNQWFLLAAPENEWKELASNVFKMPNVESSVVLIDQKLSIRNYYDINSNPEMGRLVEHVAILVPKKRRR